MPNKFFYITLLIVMFSCMNPAGNEDEAKSYTVSYDANGADAGSAVTDSNSYNSGAEIVVLDNTGNLSKSGYIFSGWNQSSDGNGGTYGTTFLMSNQDVVLYALWVEIPLYTVSFYTVDTDSGTVPDDILVSDGSVFTVPGNTGNLLKTGYIFKGWTATEDGSGDILSSLVIGGENLILHAKWTVNQVLVIQTNGDKSKLLHEEEKFFSLTSSSVMYNINLDDNISYQTIYGFGAALTDSSAWLIYNHPDRAQIMKDLFDPETGAGINYVRIALGASDFARSWYTYDDEGPDLTGFSIDSEKDYLIPLLLEALELNPSLKILGTPWTAPGWMKSGGKTGENNLAGGYLDHSYYPMYADYLYKTIEAFNNEGITLNAITLQNEPLHDTAEYPCMYMSSQDQADLVKVLGPLLEGSAYEDIKILVYDHNWDVPGYPKDVLDNLTPSEQDYVAGSAWHGYGGTPDAMTVAHTDNPDKEIFFTEITGGKWNTAFQGNLRWNFDNIIIGGLRNWAQTALLWNLALDENGEPNIRPLPADDSEIMRGVLTIGSSTVVKEVEYYILAQIAPYIQPGSIRISSNEIVEGSDTVLRTAAFRNPDGSHVLIVLNNTWWKNGITFNVKYNGMSIEHTLPDESVAVFTW